MAGSKWTLLQPQAPPHKDAAGWSFFTGPYNLLHMPCAVLVGLVLGHYIPM